MRGKVELVGFLRELGDACKIEIVGFFHTDFYVEASQIVVVLRKALLLGIALGVCLILVYLVDIVVGEFVDAEVVSYKALEKVHQFIRLGREIRHSHHRQRLFHQFTLGGIVINKHHTVESNVQFFSQFPDILVFTLPVDAMCADMLTLDRHKRIGIPQFLHISLIVFAAQGKYHAAFAQFHQALLPIQKGIARIVATDFDAFCSVFAKNAAPKGVVEVENKAFFAA